MGGFLSAIFQRRWFTLAGLGVAVAAVVLPLPRFIVPWLLGMAFGLILVPTAICPSRLSWRTSLPT